MRKNTYPVIGTIQIRRPGLTDEASEYIIRSVINHLPVIEGSVFASVAPVPGSFAVKYQGPDMPADPPKNEHYWHDSQATAGLYESWLITLSGKAEGETEADAAKAVQEHLEAMAHEFEFENICVKTGDTILSDIEPYAELCSGYPTEISKEIKI